MSEAAGGSRERDEARTPSALNALCLILAAVAWIWLGPSYARVLRPPTDPRPDYFQDWASARNHRRGLSVYAPHATTIPLYLGRPQSEHESDIAYNAHPPTSVLLALPLAGLELRNATLVWNLISLTAILASLTIVVVSLPELMALALPVGALLPFCLPVYSNFQQGQLTLVLVLLVTASWSLDRSGRPGAAGVLLGLAAALKLFPAYLVVYFAVRRRWRAVLAATATFAVLSLATAAVLGWEAYRDYVRVVLPSLEKFRSYGFNMSLSGFWYKLFDPNAELGHITPLWPSLTVARHGSLLSNLAITAVVAAVAHRAKTPAARDLAFGAAVTAMLLASPVTWAYSIPLLLVPLAVIGRAARKSDGMTIPLILILTILSLPQDTMLELTLGGEPLRVVSPDFILGPLSLGSYALLATLALGIAAFRDEDRAEANPPRQSPHLHRNVSHVFTGA